MDQFEAAPSIVSEHSLTLRANVLSLMGIVLWRCSRHVSRKITCGILREES